MTRTQATFVGLGIGVLMASAVQFIKSAPDIAVAWGNAWAEREKRLAEAERRYAEDAPRREAAQREQEAREAAIAAHNEANCKVTVIDGPFGTNKVVTGVLGIRPTIHSEVYVLRLSGGVERTSRVVHTENCR